MQATLDRTAGKVSPWKDFELQTTAPGSSGWYNTKMAQLHEHDVFGSSLHPKRVSCNGIFLVFFCYWFYQIEKLLTEKIVFVRHFSEIIRNRMVQHRLRSVTIAFQRKRLNSRTMTRTMTAMRPIFSKPVWIVIIRYRCPKHRRPIILQHRHHRHSILPSSHHKISMGMVRYFQMWHPIDWPAIKIVFHAFGWIHCQIYRCSRAI